MTLKSRENKFKLVGGSASLDFANTVGGRLKDDRAKTRDFLSTIRIERLADYLDLLAWSRKSGLLSSSEAKALEQEASRNPKTAEAVLKRAIKLREVVYRLFKSAIEGWQPDEADVAKFNEELSLATRHEALVHGKNGFHLQLADDGKSLDKMLWVLARSAAQILTSEKLLRVKQCGGDKCGWIFLDTSRSGNRTWCDMKDCGNLAKVHRFRRKKSSAN